MMHCDLRVRWKVASDLRFGAAISEPRTPSCCGISGDLAPSTRKSLAIAIVRFWCAKFIRLTSRTCQGIIWPDIFKMNSSKESRGINCVIQNSLMEMTRNPHICYILSSRKKFRISSFQMGVGPVGVNLFVHLC